MTHSFSSVLYVSTCHQVPTRLFLIACIQADMASCTSACRTFGSVVLGTQLKPRCLPTRQPRRLQAKADADLPDELSRACPVPQNQQPLSEMRELQKDTLFTWAELPAPEFVLRLAAVYLGACSAGTVKLAGTVSALPQALKRDTSTITMVHHVQGVETVQRELL